MSCNHTLRLYRQDEKRWHCGVKNCLNEATHVCSCDYLKGAKAVKHNMDRCREHAQAFRRKHGAEYLKCAGVLS